MILSLAAPAEAGNEPAPLPKPLLDFIDNVLLVLGCLSVVGAGLYWFTRERRDPLAGAPGRPNELRPEHVIVVAGGFMVLLYALHRAVDQLANPEPWRIGAANLAQLIGGLGAIAVGARNFDGGLRAFLGGRRPVGQAVLIGMALLPAALGLCALVYFVTLEFERWRNPTFVPTIHAVLKALQAGGVPIWVLWVGAVVIAPISEECFFRGLLQTMVRNAGVGPWVAAGAIGILFGISHSPQPDAIPTLAVFGFILGVVYERTGSLIAPMVLHALFNGKTMLWETVAAMS